MIDVSLTAGAFLMNCFQSPRAWLDDPPHPLAVKKKSVITIISPDEVERVSLLNVCREFESVVQLFASSEEFLQSWRVQSRPGIVLADDMNMEPLLQSGLFLDGRGAVSELTAKEDCPLLLILMGLQPSLTQVVQAISRGVLNYLPRPVSPQSLMQALSDARSRLPELISRGEILRKCRQAFKKLTPREREVFELVAHGMMNKQVATHLGIAEKTVKIHRGRVMQKLGLSTIAQLVQFSFRLHPEQLYQELNSEIINEHTSKPQPELV